MRPAPAAARRARSDALRHRFHRRAMFIPCRKRSWLSNRKDQPRAAAPRAGRCGSSRTRTVPTAPHRHSGHHPPTVTSSLAFESAPEGRHPGARRSAAACAVHPNRRPLRIGCDVNRTGTQLVHALCLYGHRPEYGVTPRRSVPAARRSRRLSSAIRPRRTAARPLRVDPAQGRRAAGSFPHLTIELHSPQGESS